MDCSNYSFNETNNQKTLSWELAIDIGVVMFLGYLTRCQLMIFVWKKEYKSKSYRISDLSNQSFCLNLFVIIADIIRMVAVLLSLSSNFVVFTSQLYSACIVLNIFLFSFKYFVL